MPQLEKKLLFGNRPSVWNRSLDLNKDAVFEKNRSSLKVFSFLTLSIVCLVIIFSLLFSAWRFFFVLSICLLAVNVAVIVLTVQTVPKKPKLLLPLTYGYFMFMMLAMIYHTIFNVEYGSTALAFSILLLILPMLILDVDFRTNCFVVLVVVIFCVASFYNFPRSVFLSFLLNSIIISLISVVLGNMVRHTKLNDLESQRLLTLQRDFDELTALPNRRKLFSTFGLLTDSSSGPMPFGIMMIDLDDFKGYNDAYGHQEGDECLRSIGHCFLEFSKNNGLDIFRFGGEEFLGLCLNCNYNRIGQLSEDLITAVEALALPCATSDMDIVTVSVGFADSNDCGLIGFEKVTSAADAALYFAKNDGKGRCVGFLDPAMDMADLSSTACIRNRI